MTAAFIIARPQPSVQTAADALASAWAEADLTDAALLPIAYLI